MLQIRASIGWQRIFSHALLAFLVMAPATGLLFALGQVIDPLPIALLYFLPVGLCAAVWGLVAGITAAVLAFLGLNYFFIEPRFTLFVHQSQDLIVLFVFLGVAIFISQMVGQTRDSLAAARDREQEAFRLFQLSAELAGLHNDRQIMRSIAGHIVETFHALRVEVEIRDRGEGTPTVFHLPEGDVASLSGPALRIPLQKPDQLIGEIRLWRTPPEFSPAEERLLRTFSYQGVIALERSHLIQAETRARVLEESDRMKTSLLSSVSHELRTPLATIKAASTSLRSEAVSWDSDARRDLLQAIEEETDHLNLLVGNLLDMSRIESGALKPERRWNALDEIIDNVIHRMRTTVRKYKIEVDVSQDLPLVSVDDVQIGQVFTNLISNSMKHAPVNSVIRIYAERKDDEFLEVQVSNQGPPVPEADLDLIFEKFHRVSSIDRNVGIGLGLSICKGIVEAHGGRIWANNISKGFAIHFTLPLTWQGTSPVIPEEHESTTTHPGH